MARSNSTPSRTAPYSARQLAQVHRALLWAAAGVLVIGACLAAPARAMTPLDDQEMSRVSGQAAPVDLSKLKNAPVLGTLFKLIPSDHLHTSQLDKAQFEAALAERGASGIAALYNGSTVTQVVVDGPPVNASVEAGQFVTSAFGVNYQGPSMGTINIGNLDARGTTLWMWSH